MKFKITCSPQTRGSVTKKFISNSLTIGLLLNTTLPSLASTLSEDGRYETFSGNDITVNNILEEDKANIEIEGNTMVNVANQKDPVPITKSYKVEGNNHIPLQGDYDGKARPVIEGNTTYYNNDTGQLTDTFVEGANLSLKSSFEDQFVTQDMVNSGQEESKNLGKYKVEYKTIGKNKAKNASSLVTTNEAGLSLDHLIDGRTYTISISGTSDIHRIKVSKRGYSNAISDPDSVCVDESGSAVADKQTTFVYRKGKGWQLFIAKLNEDGTGSWIKDGTSLEHLVQIEEGSTATEYEPYKESIKTFYLNSPLLEGDTIEDINGKATHIKRYKKVVLDGSENWANTGAALDNPNYTNYFIEPLDISLSPNMYCDKIKTRFYEEGKTAIGMDCEDFLIGGYTLYPNLRICTTMHLMELKQWLQANPTTVVYQLASPQYETISEEFILIDSYKDGHLDLNSNIPVNKVDFISATTNLNYLYPSTKYTVQFESDNKGKIDTVLLSSNILLEGYPVRKGVNRFNITTPSEILSTELTVNGIGFNLSNLVVTKVMDENFDYFEGIQSSFENNLVTQEMVNIGQEKTENLGKYKVEVKSTGKNKFDVLSYAKIIESLGVGDYTNNVLTIRKSDSFVDKDIPNIVYQPNTPYTISFDFENIARPDNPCNEIILRVYYTDGTRKDITPWSFTGLSRGHVVARTDATKTISYIRFSYILPTGETKFKNIQIEEGVEATPYEPYKELINTFYLNSPLLEGDRIEYIDGQPTHLKRYEKIVFDGSDDENWTLNHSGEGYYTYYTRLSNFDSRLEPVIISDNFIYVGGASTIFLPSQGFKVHANYSNVLYLCVSKLTSATEVNQWLQNNPTTVVYKLASPIYEPIKADLSAQLFEDTTHISNNSNIPLNMEIIVDRTINKAVEYINLAKTNPTIENIAIARMWSNLLKDSIKKDDLQSDIDNITEITDLKIDKKKVSANLDLYVKSENALSMSLDTNSVTFENYNNTEDIEKLGAVNITVSSSLPYDLNAYMPSGISNADGTKTMDSNLLNIREDSTSSYKPFVGVDTKISLKEDCSAGNNNIHTIDFKLNGSQSYDVDVYRTVIKFEAQQK